jgi:hypothetical protein
MSLSSINSYNSSARIFEILFKKDLKTGIALIGIVISALMQMCTFTPMMASGMYCPIAGWVCFAIEIVSVTALIYLFISKKKGLDNQKQFEDRQFEAWLETKPVNGFEFLPTVLNEHILSFLDFSESIGFTRTNRGSHESYTLYMAHSLGFSGQNREAANSYIANFFIVCNPNRDRLYFGDLYPHQSLFFNFIQISKKEVLSLAYKIRKAKTPITSVAVNQQIFSAIFCSENRMGVIEFFLKIARKQRLDEFLNVNSQLVDRTPLMSAVALGDEALVDLLLSANADVNFENQYSQNVLDHISQYTTITIVGRLLARGINYKRQDGSRRALHYLKNLQEGSKIRYMGSGSESYRTRQRYNFTDGEPIIELLESLPD